MTHRPCDDMTNWRQGEAENRAAVRVLEVNKRMRAAGLCERQLVSPQQKI
jgi:hypothetical protein